MRNSRMYKYLFAATLFVLPLAVGCSGEAPPTTVSDEERQQMLEQEKQVEAEERAHRAQGN